MTTDVGIRASPRSPSPREHRGERSFQPFRAAVFHDAIVGANDRVSASLSTSSTVSANANSTYFRTSFGRWRRSFSLAFDSATILMPAP